MFPAGYGPVSYVWVTGGAPHGIAGPDGQVEPEPCGQYVSRSALMSET